jgi:hypothetical protein
MNDQTVDREDSRRQEHARLTRQLVSALAPTSESERAELERAILAGAAAEGAEAEDARVRLGRAALALATTRTFPAVPDERGERAGSSPDGAIIAATLAELRRLPLAQRIAVLALWQGLEAEDAAVLLATSAAGARRLADLGLDGLRRSLARRGLSWDPQAAAAPAIQPTRGAEAAAETMGREWLGELENAGTATKRLALLEPFLKEPAAAARLGAMAGIARLSGIPLGSRILAEGGGAERAKSLPVRIWGAVVVVGAVALFLLAGGWENVRPVFPGPAGETEVLPLPVSPQGSHPSPPLHFRWKASADDVDFAQVILYRRSYERFWESGPTVGNEVTVPLQAYEGVGAGETCYWRVREVADGKPRGSSPFIEFEFAVDSRGYGPGEAPPPELLVD